MSDDVSAASFNAPSVSTKPKARRYRQFIVTLPADVAERLTADHRNVVADAMSRGEVAPNFDRFLEILLDLGRRAVLAPVPTPEAT